MKRGLHRRVLTGEIEAMPVSEPATMITDYALALVCSFFALSIHRRSAGGRASLWAAAFSVTAFAALAGGTFHGLRVLLGPK